MRFEWDERKNQTNRAKHGISFDTAIQAFEDPARVFRFDRMTDAEERWHLIGATFANTIVFIVHTSHAENGDEIVRIISARKANALEKRTYQSRA